MADDKKRAANRARKQNQLKREIDDSKRRASEANKRPYGR